MGVLTLMEEELFRAAVCGDIGVLSEANISRRGFSYFVDRTTPENNSIIHVAAEYDQYRFVEEALTVFPELIFGKNNDKDTPLHVAAREGNRKTVGVLISWSGCATKDQSKAEEDWVWMVKNSEGDTPLHLALSSNKLNVAMDILKVGSVKVLSLVNVYQETPLHIFIRNCCGTRTTASALLEEGVLNLQGMYVVQGDDFGASRQGSQSIVKSVLIELLKYKPAMCSRDVKGLSPLLIAAQQGCLQVVNLIISCCPMSAEVRDLQGRTVLHLLNYLSPENNAWEEVVDPRTSQDSLSLRYKELKELLNIPEINALKNRKDCQGNTPAHAAVETQAFVFVRVLMESFADFNIKNKNGISALDILSSLQDFPLKMEELRVIEKLTSKPMDTELIEAASITGDISLFLKRGGRDVESGEMKYDDDYFLSRTPEGFNILHLAVQYGHVKFVEEAIKQFPTLVFTADCSGETPLHRAARLQSNHSVATTLLQLTTDSIDKLKEEAGDKFLHGLPWRQKNSKGNLPLHEAICSSNYDLAIALMHIDPKLSSFQNRAGETPLHILARYGAYAEMGQLGDLIKLLVGQNCNLIAYTRDTDGFTPLLRAAYCGRFQVACHILRNCFGSLQSKDPNGRIFLHHLRVVSNAEIDATNDMFHAFGSILPYLTTEGLRSTQDGDGNTPLHFALREKNFAAAKFLLLCCVRAPVRTELTITNNQGHSVFDLLAALAADNPDVKELKELALVGQRKLVEAALGTKMMEAEVYKAAVRGRVDLLDSLKGGSDNSDDDSKFLSRAADGSNILHLACQHNHVAFVEETLKRYPDLMFEVDCNGNTPLHIAAMFYDCSFKKLVKYHDEHCRKVYPEFRQEPFTHPWRVKNSKGNTPVHEAMQSSLNIEASEALLRFDPTLILFVNDAGETPLHVFARCGTYYQGDETIDVLEFLLSQNSSAAYMRDREGLTPLLRAAKTGRLLVAYTILKYCPQSIQLRDLNGRTFLHLLHFTGPEFNDTTDEKLGFPLLAKPFFDIPEVESLLNVVDFDGNTPLHFSIKDGNSFNSKFIAQRLMEKDIGETFQQTWLMRDGKGQNVLDLLALHDDAPNEVLELFQKKMGSTFTHVRSSHGICKTQIKDMANTLSVVAGLLATLTFAAAFQVPGGFNDDGNPILGRKAAFHVFMISNTCALCGSMVVLFSLLWVMLTGKLTDSFILLDLSISMLVLSFNATLVGFMTGVYVAISPTNLWLAIFPIVQCSLVIVLMRKYFVLHITRFFRLLAFVLSFVRAGTLKEVLEFSSDMENRAKSAEEHAKTI